MICIISTICWGSTGVHSDLLALTQDGVTERRQYSFVALQSAWADIEVWTLGGGGVSYTPRELILGYFCFINCPFTPPQTSLRQTPSMAAIAIPILVLCLRTTMEVGGKIGKFMKQKSPKSGIWVGGIGKFSLFWDSREALLTTHS